MISRRRFLQGSIAAAATGAAAAAYARFIEPEWVELVEHDLPLAGLPPELDGCTVVQLSDLHVGQHVSSDYLRRSLRGLRALEPDVIAVTGDWVTYRDARETDELARVLEALPPARLATLGILGNHDYGDGWRHEPVAAAVRARLEQAGVRVRNERTVVGGLTIVGVEDLWCPRCPRSAADLGWSEGAARNTAAQLVLCHNPDAADRPIWGDFHGWILAGHTHGGQCRPPFLPPPLLPVRNRAYTAGAIRVDGQRSMYINRGLGHLQKVRFNARPEITRHRLRAARR